MTRLIAKTLATSSGKHNDRTATIEESSDSSFLLEPKAIDGEAFLEDPIGKNCVG
jgi:hypothetical protein